MSIRSSADIAADLERVAVRNHLGPVSSEICKEAAAALRAQKPLVVTDAMVEAAAIEIFNALDGDDTCWAEYGYSGHKPYLAAASAALTAALTSDNEAGQTPADTPSVRGK
jgi:hypothetical protein